MDGEWSGQGTVTRLGVRALEGSNRGRVRVAAANDYELVVSGVAALLRLYADRLEVRDRIVMGEPIVRPMRTPVRNSALSVSIFWRPPRP